MIKLDVIEIKQTAHDETVNQVSIIEAELDASKQ